MTSKQKPHFIDLGEAVDALKLFKKYMDTIECRWYADQVLRINNFYINERKKENK